MPKIESKTIEVGQCIAFRVPDAELCEAITVVLDATGYKLNDLLILALREGLVIAYDEIRRHQQQAHLKASTIGIIANRPKRKKGAGLIEENGRVPTS